MNVKDYFNELAPKYENKIQKKFWNLSDDLLWDLTKEQIAKIERSNVKLLDAGGGTGFWTKKILKEFNHLEVDICDISCEMLNVARKELDSKKVNITKCKVEELPYENDSFDISICYYVLPFIQDLQKTLAELSRVTKKDGIILLAFENLYHGLSLNLLCNKISRVHQLLAGDAVRIADHIPKLNFNSFSEMNELLNANDIVVTHKFGFPVISNVGVREKITGNNYSISDVLKTKENYSEILGIEKVLIRDEALVNRGKYIFITGVKK